MGGNAIKNADTRRFNADEYFSMYEHVWNKLTDHHSFVGRKFHIIDSYTEKETFGDMDILVAKPAGGKWNSEAFTGIFPSKEVVVNGDVISMEYRGFQLDFIQVPAEQFAFARTYFAWNDLGNLIGKVARTLGLKYGHQGLIYTIRDGLGDKVGEIPVTLDPEEALTFLGYDWARFQKGFNNLEEIFEFVITSKYFDASVYALDKLNHVDRIRDKKRATYQAFLTWIEDKDLPVGVKREDRSIWFVPEIRKAFPEFGMRYDLTKAQLNRKRDCKMIFNGEVVSILTGLKGKELGDFMMAWRSWFGYEHNLQDYVLHTAREELHRAIKAFHEKRQKTLQ